MVLVGCVLVEPRRGDRAAALYQRRAFFFKAGPLDLSFWSFLTFLHHGIEEVKRHLL